MTDIELQSAAGELWPEIALRLKTVSDNNLLVMAENRALSEKLSLAEQSNEALTQKCNALLGVEAELIAAQAACGDAEKHAQEIARTAQQAAKALADGDAEKAARKLEAAITPAREKRRAAIREQIEQLQAELDA